MKVVFDSLVEDFLYDLVEILYEKNYFEFYEEADDYVSGLVYDITTSIPYKLQRPAPPHFNRYGKNMSYVVFKKNNYTQWYVFFNQEDDIYYIRYIGNNHTCAQYFP
ncbi:MAG: hypothetical protein LBS46_00925 [Dysgonamonadaceae bacterium]|jgi:hypothetical protein|nr:hypothetical protein [Dysgonamonadaceae bacterium]